MTKRTSAARRCLPARLRALSLLYLASWLPWVFGWRLPLAASLAGTATSLVNTGGFLGTALFQPLVGWVLDRIGAEVALDGYRSAAAVLTAIALAGVAAAFRIRGTRCRNVYREIALLQ